mmetsp:Transcript_117706/g.234514  ORF Transcript_117706/g.234514 Transcript_117706/m.234514 type:complete len:100 (+) Transcript_117706:174-473(+)
MDRKLEDATIEPLTAPVQSCLTVQMVATKNKVPAAVVIKAEFAVGGFAFGGFPFGGKPNAQPYSANVVDNGCAHGKSYFPCSSGSGCPRVLRIKSVDMV